MIMKEAYPEAAAILAAAGWKPHDRWGVYTKDTLVMGISPDGQFFDVKNWGLDIHGPDTPDTPVEAAEWLVNLRRVVIIEEEPHAAIPESQAPSEPAEAEPHSVGGGSEAAAAEDAGSAEDGSASGGGALLAHDGQAWESDSGLEPDYDLEAEFTEIAPEELTETADLLELEAPDLGADIVAAEEEAGIGDQARFYGLDDLDRVRRLRIGDVAASAAVRVNAIEAMVSEKTGEFAGIQGYVVSNLDKHTGAFTPQDEASLATYARFLELSEARNRIAAIDQRRKDATAYLLDETRTREEVVAFDPEADWPAF